MFEPAVVCESGFLLATKGCIRFMRVETNDKLVRRNRQLAQYLFFFTFGFIILIFLLMNQLASSIETVDVALAWGLQVVVLVVVSISTFLSVRMTNLWVREPRPETALREGLKGLSNKSVLYNYYHLPARHILIAPQGVFAITAKFQHGRYSVVGDQWKTHRSAIGRFLSAMRFEGIGNPTQEALRNAAHVQKLLQPIVPDIEVQPLIVFVDPRATITITDPVVPVLRAQDKLEPGLRDYMRDVGKHHRMTLTPEQIKAFEDATLPRR
jgi:hypothetical protein